MAIKDYWLYQQRDSEKPWAVYLVKEYDMRIGYDATSLDFTVYHDDIPNKHHMISEVCIHYETLAGYVNHLVTVISEYTTVYDSDVRYLTRELGEILGL